MVVVGGGGGGWWLLMLLLVVVVLLLLLRVRIPQVHLPHPRPVPLSAVVASAPEHTHTQIAHRTNPDPTSPPAARRVLTTDGAYRDGINAQCWAVDWARFARLARLAKTHGKSCFGRPQVDQNDGEGAYRGGRRRPQRYCGSWRSPARTSGGGAGRNVAG